MGYSYTQLEQLWVAAGGAPAMASTMAAIGMAESGGNPNAYNPTDNNGKQTSWGIWQISNGTHAEPSPTWNNPLTNAQLAVQKYQDQGLSAWGTYTSGAYLNYLSQGGQPSAAQTAQTVAASSYRAPTPGPGGNKAVSLGPVGTMLQYTDRILNPQTKVILWFGSINTSVVAQFATRSLFALLGFGIIYTGFKTFSASGTSQGNRTFVAQVERAVNAGSRVQEARIASQRTPLMERQTAVREQEAANRAESLRQKAQKGSTKDSSKVKDKAKSAATAAAML